jgi:hypothetical protein
MARSILAGMPPISRRTAGKLLLAAPALPAAAIAAAQSEPPPKPSPFASCIAASEHTFSAEERARLEKAIGGLEQSLKTIREFKLPPDTDPAMHFRPLQSPRRRDGQR